MESTEPDIEAIGHGLREALAGEFSEDEQIRRARIGFVQEVSRRSSSPSSSRSWRLPRRRWLPWALTASLCAGAAGTLFWSRSVSFEVDGVRSGRVGEVIESTEGRSTPVHFSEGSSVLLQGRSRMRVLSLATEAARIVVDDGVLDVSIAHRKARRTRWSFEAGPYSVVVTGTKFRMAFAARQQSLRVSTEEGQVVVSGGCHPTPQKVSAGQSVDLSCLVSGEASSTEAGEVEDPTLRERETDTEPQGQPVPDVVVPQPSPSPPPPSRGELAWRRLLASGQLWEGFQAADRAGLQRVSQIATARELLALADAARLHGSPARAVTLLLRVRQRFPETKDAAAAAFRLGLTAFEGAHAYAEASKWFETYLREQPAGPLMGDSFGRLMKAKSLSGDLEGARDVAQQYLRRFPEGPYAADARGILSR